MIRKPNVIILSIVVTLVLIQQLILRPASVEVVEDDIRGMTNSLEAQIEAQKIRDEIKYTLEGVHYTSLEKGVPSSEMTAKSAMVYDKSNLFVGEDVKIRMIDGTQKSTDITGKRAFFKMGSKEMDLENNVHVLFPDGFWIDTEKAHYSAADQRVSSQEPFHGEQVSKAEGVEQKIRVWGTGFLGSKNEPDVHVLSSSKVIITKSNSNDRTEIHSDIARIDRFTRFSEYTMAAKDRFVESDQGTMHIKSRKQEATYDPVEAKAKTMTALEDVTIRETDPEKLKDGMKYATCQRADFIPKENKILLTGFPSVYQENDTVTGEQIIVYRDTNLVEVTDANAYHDARE